MFSGSTRQRQQGAISVLAAAALGVSIAVAALALDLGHVFWLKRDLQKAADLASLSALTDLGQATGIAQSIALENDFDYQDAATANSLVVMTGRYDWSTRSFAAGGAAAELNSVQVTVGTTAPYYFLPGSRRVTANATAARDAVAGFSLGSYLARLNTADSALLNGVLGGLLGSAVSLDLISYQGLAAGSVTLAGLQAALGLATMEDVLNANVTLADLVAALNLRGDAASLNAAGILVTVSSGISWRVGDLIKVDSGNPQKAANAEINLLQLLTLGAELANADSASLINVPLAVSVPGIASVDMALALIEKPSIAIGPARRDSGGEWMTKARSAQVRLRLKLTLLDLVGGGVVSLPIYIEGGAADAALTGIQCRSPRDSSDVIIQVQPQLLTSYIGEVSDAAMQNHAVPVTPGDATLLDVAGLVRITGHASVPVQTPAQELVFNGPFDQNNTQTAGGSSLGIGGLLNSDLHLDTQVLGLTLPLVGQLLQATLSTLLGSILGPVLDGLLDPLLSLLGLQLGGGDVTAFHLDCGAPQLVY